MAYTAIDGDISDVHRLDGRGHRGIQHRGLWHRLEGHPTGDLKTEWASGKIQYRGAIRRYLEIGRKSVCRENRQAAACSIHTGTELFRDSDPAANDNNRT